MQSRTHWHDLLGRHCPRFGQDSTVDAQMDSLDAEGHSFQSLKVHSNVSERWNSTEYIRVTAGGSPNPKARGLCHRRQIQDTIHI